MSKSRYLGKKKIRKLRLISVCMQVLEQEHPSYYVGTERRHFTEDPPNEWSDDEDLSYRIASETEMAVLKEVFEILGVDRYSEKVRKATGIHV